MGRLILRAELEGLPPTVNHLYRSTYGGQRYKTQEARDYQDYAVAVLAGKWRGREAYTGDAELRLTFVTPDRRRWDIDNRVKAVQDCLERAGVLKNDTQIMVLHVERQTDKDADTRTVIRLKER